MSDREGREGLAVGQDPWPTNKQTINICHELVIYGHRWYPCQIKPHQENYRDHSSGCLWDTERLILALGLGLSIF